MSVSIGEAIPGAAGIAVPIMRGDGVVNEALLLAGSVGADRARSGTAEQDRPRDR